MGDDAIRQVRAIQSWRLSFPECEILAFGKSGDSASLLHQYGIIQHTDLPLGEDRLPRIDMMFGIAQKQGLHDVQVYINGDIIVGVDFSLALSLMPSTRWMAVSRRYNCDIGDGVELRASDDILAVQRGALKSGELFAPCAIDVFGYMRGCLRTLAPFYVGAIRWDNYMIGHALRSRLRVVDLTSSAIVVHQNHDHDPINGKKPVTITGAAAQENISCYQSVFSPALKDYYFDTYDSTHVLRSGKIIPACESLYIANRLRRIRMLYPWLFRLPIPWRMHRLMAWYLPYLGVR